MASVSAQTYPTKPIRLVIPAGPATPTDIISRWVVDGMAKDLGQPIIVENKPGGVYRIGFQEVARASADGYTMVVAAMPMAVAPSIRPTIRSI